jgi:hypothetical protein
MADDSNKRNWAREHSIDGGSEDETVRDEERVASER